MVFVIKCMGGFTDFTDLFCNLHAGLRSPNSTTTLRKVEHYVGVAQQQPLQIIIYRDYVLMQLFPLSSPSCKVLTNLCCLASWCLIQNVLMPNSPKTAAEWSSVRSEGKEATVQGRRDGSAIIGCQKCHLLSACEWEEFEIRRVMPLWRRITRLIWHLPQPTVYGSTMLILTETKCNKIFHPLSIPSTLKSVCTTSLLKVQRYGHKWWLQSQAACV